MSFDRMIIPVLAAYEKTCAECGKLFIIPNRDYAYKLRYKNIPTWYCGYSCWRKHQKAIENGNIESTEKYLESLRRRKNLANKRRRERQNGTK